MKRKGGYDQLKLKSFSIGTLLNKSRNELDLDSKRVYDRIGEVIWEKGHRDEIM